MNFQKSTNISTYNSNYTLCDLNDDCLLAIFEYLPFNEQLIMSSFSLRFETIFILLYKTSKILYVDSNEIAVNIFFQGLKNIGDYIETIKSRNGVLNRYVFCPLCPTYCPNLKNLNLNILGYKMEEFNYGGASRNFHLNHRSKLETLSVTNEAIESFSYFKTIEHLDLSFSLLITGEHLDKFKNLKTLILDQCRNIKLINFIKIANKLKNTLNELNICNCELLDLSAVRIISKKLTKLETLNISIKQLYKIDGILELKMLKHLTIRDYKDTSSETFFSKLSDKLPLLETFRVYNFYINDIKIKAITNLNNLKQLDLFFNESRRYPDIFLSEFSKLKNLKILNIHLIRIRSNIILEYINESPNIEYINISSYNYVLDNIIDLIEILTLQNRITPLTLCIKMKNFTNINLKLKKQSKNGKFLFKEHENILKLKIDNTNQIYDEWRQCF